jgi:hypothetical protein
MGFTLTNNRRQKNQKTSGNEAAGKKGFTKINGSDIDLSLIFQEISSIKHIRSPKTKKEVFYGKKESYQINHKKENGIPKKKRLKTIRTKRQNSQAR